MFPTINHLINYLTGLRLQPSPIQTFGFFIGLAFWLAYIAFKKEFKRKEDIGLIKPFTRKEITGAPASVLALTLYGVSGFLVGYKFVYVFQHYQQFTYDASDLLFSLKGNIIGGLVVGSIFSLWIYFQKRQERLSVPVVQERLIHPYKITDQIMLWCACIGFIGAIIFPKLEFIGQMFTNPIQYFTTLSGMAFYGGLIFGAGIFLYKTKKMGIPFLVAADIGSPGMILAYAVGRMGCHLSGDGDWGMVNLTPKPHWLSWLPDWIWSFDFPHNVIHQGKYIEGCGDGFCSVLTQPVYPTSFYESIICLGIFATLWLCRSRIKINGQMFFIFLLCNGIERFFMEFIKINIRYCTLNICLTQAQIIALALCVAGIAGLIWLFIVKKKHKLI